MTDQWTLGALVQKNGNFRFEGLRVLSEAELEDFNTALARLTHFSGHALVGALVESPNELNELLAEMDSLTPHELQRSAFRAKLNSKLSNWLTTFSGFRAHIEKCAAKLNLPMGSSAENAFKTAYNQHPEYRLTWQLRNLDQHDPPVGALITIRSEFDLTGKPAYRPMLDHAKLFADRITANDRYASQWQGCADLWKDRCDEVDIRELFHHAYKACERILAIYVTEPEYLLVADVIMVARMHAEASHLGYPCIYKVQPSEDDGKIDIQSKAIDPLIFGETLIAIDGARKILGKPPLDLEHDPRFGPKDADAV